MQIGVIVEHYYGRVNRRFRRAVERADFRGALFFFAQHCHRRGITLSPLLSAAMANQEKECV